MEDALGDEMKNFSVQRDEPIRIHFPNPAHAAAISVNGLRLADDSVVIPPPDAGQESADLDLTLDPEARQTGIHIEIHSGKDVFRQFIAPGSELVRLHFAYESGPKLIWCAKHDSYVIPDENGRCPIHH